MRIRITIGGISGIRVCIRDCDSRRINYGLSVNRNHACESRRRNMHHVVAVQN